MSRGRPNKIQEISDDDKEVLAVEKEDEEEDEEEEEEEEDVYVFSTYSAMTRLNVLQVYR